jgi:hypothetical protein
MCQPTILIPNQKKTKAYFLPSMKVLQDAGDRDMVVEAGIVPKWVMRATVKEEWEVVLAEKEEAIGEEWDAGCIMAVGKAGLRNAHSLGQL